MDEQNLDQLKNTLIKLIKLENAILNDRGLCDELVDIRMLLEFVKEQVPYEDTAHTAG